MNLDKILIPHRWYLYKNNIRWPILIQFQYKLKAQNSIANTVDYTEQAAYVFEVFGRDQTVYKYIFPMHIILSDLKLGQLRPVEINLSFVDLFK